MSSRLNKDKFSSNKHLLSSQSVDIRPVSVGTPATSNLTNHHVTVTHLNNSVEKSQTRSFLENKVYFIAAVIFSLFYFLDVFIGMFMIHNEFLT